MSELGRSISKAAARSKCAGDGLGITKLDHRTGNGIMLDEVGRIPI
jgi:hypothetical protein